MNVPLIWNKVYTQIELFYDYSVFKRSIVKNYSEQKKIYSRYFLFISINLLLTEKQMKLNSDLKLLKIQNLKFLARVLNNASSIGATKHLLVMKYLAVLFSKNKVNTNGVTNLCQEQNIINESYLFFFWPGVSNARIFFPAVKFFLCFFYSFRKVVKDISKTVTSEEEFLANRLLPFALAWRCLLNRKWLFRS